MFMNINGYTDPHELSRTEIESAIEHYLVEAFDRLEFVRGSGGEYAAQVRTGRGLVQFLLTGVDPETFINWGMDETAPAVDVEEVEFDSWPPQERGL